MFASPRERRLWLWTLATVAGIYSTLGLAPSLADVVGDSPILVGLFVAGMLLVAGAVLTEGLRTRPRGVEIGVALGVAAVYLLLFVRLSLPERSHLIEYGVVAVFVYEALTERKGHGRRVPAPALLAIALTAFLGLVDETIQAFLPNRVFEPVDLLFNALAGLMAVAGLAALRWVRGWAKANLSARDDSPR